MTEPIIPSGPHDLTASWVNAVLGERGGVTGVTVEPLGGHVGFLGDLYRLRLDRDDPSSSKSAGPASVVVKLPPTDPGGRQVGAMLGVGPREVAFYRDVVSAAPGVPVPGCYHAVAGGVDRWVLVLEDLAPPATGGAPESGNDAPDGEGEPDPAAKGADLEQARAAVSALVDFQAPWWDSDQAFEWMPGFDDRGVGGLRDAWLDAIPVFLERYAHVVPDPTGDWLQRFAPTLPDWSDRMAAETLTIVHADYRLDNLVFGIGGDSGAGVDSGAGADRLRVTMIDWQTALRGPGPMDLASFVATALTIEDRRRWEDELIERYRTGLAGRGIELARDELDLGFDEQLLWWMGQFANNLARLEPDDPVAQRILDTTIERTFTAGLDRNVGRLLS